jgi:hypothetical protein
MYAQTDLQAREHHRGGGRGHGLGPGRGVGVDDGGGGGAAAGASPPMPGPPGGSPRDARPGPASPPEDDPRARLPPRPCHGGNGGPSCAQHATDVHPRRRFPGHWALSGSLSWPRATSLVQVRVLVPSRDRSHPVTPDRRKCPLPIWHASAPSCFPNADLKYVRLSVARRVCDDPCKSPQPLCRCRSFAAISSCVSPKKN